MPKLLIAESSQAVTCHLQKSLKNEWEIFCVSDGYAAIDTLKYLSPDAMILNLNLNQKDGIAVLEEAFPRVPPVTLALSTYISPYVLQTAASLGVGYILPRPFTVDAVKQRLREMYAAYMNAPDILLRHLSVLGINPKHNGYRYLLHAVRLFAKDQGQRMQKEIYIETAAACRANGAECVEHSIRTAIRSAWKMRDRPAWLYYFPGDQCPTNSEFIACLAKLL